MTYLIYKTNGNYAKHILKFYITFENLQSEVLKLLRSSSQFNLVKLLLRY